MIKISTINKINRGDYIADHSHIDCNMFINPQFSEYSNSYVIGTWAKPWGVRVIILQVDLQHYNPYMHIGDIK